MGECGADVVAAVGVREHAMSASMESDASGRITAVATYSAVLAAVIGMLAWVGWTLHMPVLTQLYATGSAMQPVTALSAIAAAAAILAVVSLPRRPAASGLFALLVLATALQTLVQYWTDSDFGTDRLFFAEAVGRQSESHAYPGRMSEPTAAAFLLIAVALLSIRVRGRGEGLVLSGCATIVLLLVAVALLSHLYAVTPLTGALGFTQMAVPTALALGGLSVGVLALRPGGGWVSLLIGHSVGATAARRLLPIVILVPIGVASAALRGSEAGWYPGDFRMAFTTAVTIILLAALALWGTWQLDGLIAERRTSEALRQSQATLRAFFETEGLLASIIERRADGVRYLAANAALARLYGKDDLAGLPVRDVGPAEASASLLDRLTEVERTDIPSSMEQAIDTPGGVRWFMVTISPIADSPPDAPRFATASLDITDRKRAEAHQRMLLDELNHRVKNTLAVVQSLALQSFRGDQATAEARRSFDARLAAVAAAHHLLVRQDWTSASLPVLIADVVGPGCGADHDRIDADGPDILLPPPMAVSLALAFHELCTNAVKYGALSNDTGRVTIRWTVNDSLPGTLHIIWSESGGPTVAMPAERGFGSKLIERALSAELGGPVKMSFDPQGLVCHITAAIPIGEAARG